MATEREPTVRDVVGLVKRGFAAAVAVAVLAAAATYAVNLQRVPSYEAQATVITTAQDPAQRAFGSTLVTAPALATATYRAATVSRSVLADAWLEVEGASPSEEELMRFARTVSVRSEDANVSALLRITVGAPDRQLARERADAVARALVAWDEERATRSLETIIASLEAQIEVIQRELEVAEADLVAGLERTQAELVLQLSSARALRTGAIGRVELFETAATPVRPVSPRPVRDALIAALLAVVLVYGLTLLRAAFDDRLRTVADLAEICDAPVLAVFPKVRGGRQALPAEAATYLRTGVSFATSNVHPRVIMVTSARDGQGKSSVAIALAKAFTRQRFRTVLIDADLRSPVIAAELGILPANVTSLADVLAGAAAIRTSLIRVGADDDDEFLHVLPSFGPSEYPSELLGAFMEGVLNRLRDEYDVVIIDAPPVLPVADALTIGRLTSGVLLVASLARTDRSSVVSANALLRRLDIPVIGVVANQARLEGAEHLAYGYGYGGSRQPSPRA